MLKNGKVFPLETAKQSHLTQPSPCTALLLISMGMLVKMIKGCESEWVVGVSGKPPLAGNVHGLEDSRGGLGLKPMQDVLCVVSGCT